MALDAASAAFVRNLAETGAPPMHETSPQAARQSLAALAAMLPEQAPAAVEREAGYPGPAGDLRALVVAPERPRAVIVYLHGGGWTTGSIDENRSLARQLAAATGCAIVLPGYRLAPEHPWPAAVVDAEAGLHWAAANLADLAAGSAPLIVAGDSAGGNLSAVLARRARDEDGPTLAGQVLIYPVTDHDPTTGSYLAPENQLGLNAATMNWFWNFYAPPGVDRNHPDLSPVRATSLADLPPAIVLTAEHDVLRDEGEAYAQALREAGVPVVERRFDGQMHGFFTMPGLLPGQAVAVRFLTQSLEAMITGAQR